MAADLQRAPLASQIAHRKAAQQPHPFRDGKATSGALPARVQVIEAVVLLHRIRIKGLLLGTAAQTSPQRRFEKPALFVVGFVGVAGFVGVNSFIGLELKALDIARAFAHGKQVAIAEFLRFGLAITQRVPQNDAAGIRCAMSAAMISVD